MYPPLNPVIQLGPLSLHWYGIIQATAILVSAWVAGRYVARKGEKSSTIWDMLLWIIIPALIGERLYYVFIQSPRSGPNGLPDYLAHPIKILEIWNGGLHIYGAFIFGGIAIVLYARWRNLPLLIYLDAVALALPLGQAIGRWANFINQELYGPPTMLPWGLRIDPAHRIPPYNDLTRYPESVRFHPLFLYESVANLIGFLLLLWIARRFSKRLRDGDLFLLYLIWYPLVRFCLEFLRTDSWFFTVLGVHFNTVHILSAIAIVFAVTMLIVRHRSKPKTTEIQGTGDELPVGNVEANGANADEVGNNDVKVVGVEADTSGEVLDDTRTRPHG